MCTDPNCPCVNHQETFIVTADWVHAHGTNGIGFTNEQFKIIGVKPKFNSGWLRRLVGTKLTLAQKKAFEDAFMARQEQRR